MKDARDSDLPRWLEGATAPEKQALRQALDDAPRFTSSEVRQRRVWARVADPRRAGRAVRRAFVMGVMATSGLAVGALVVVERVAPGLGGFISGEARTAAPAVNAIAPPVTATPSPAPPGPPSRPPPQPPAAVPLLPGRSEVLRTAAGERVTRTLGQGAQAELQPRSLLALDADGTPEVRAGQIAFKVAHQPTGQAFQVRARGFTVVVVGTRFVVTVDDTQDRVAVSVDEGIVEIWDKTPNGSGRLARLTVGQSWTDAAGAAARSHPRASATAASPATAGARRDSRSPPGISPRAPTPPTSPTPMPTVTAPGADLAAARAARAATDPKRALAIYQRLADRGGPLAENALYESGGIYRDHLDQPRRALAVWERYRTRYPRGLLRAEADLSIVDTLSSMGESRRALEEALAFLRHHPRSERRGEIARLAGDLHRSGGRCRQALELYDTVDATTAARADADDAAYGRAACLDRLADGRAVSALRGYLRDWPAGRHHGEATRLLAGRSGAPAP